MPAPRHHPPVPGPRCADALAYLASNTQDWLHLGHRDLDKALSASNVTVAGDAAHIPVPSFLNCNETLVKDLRKRLSKHRFERGDLLAFGPSRLAPPRCTL